MYLYLYLFWLTLSKHVSDLETTAVLQTLVEIWRSS